MLTIPGYGEEQIGYHAVLMIEAELACGFNATPWESRSPSAHLTRLTWKGHEFLDASREEGRWEKAKQIAAKAGGVTADVLKQILANLMTEALKLG